MGSRCAKLVARYTCEAGELSENDKNYEKD